MVYVAEIAEVLMEPFVLVDMNGHRKGPYMKNRQIQDMEEYWSEVCSIYYDEDNKILTINI